MNEKKPVSNVCYQIAAKNGRVLEVADFNTASGAAVQLWDNVKEDSQIWLLVEVAEGLYKLENKLTGKVLDVINAGSQNGAWLHQWDYIGKDNQLWTLEPAADGRWKVRSKLSGRVLDIVGMSQENGARRGRYAKNRACGASCCGGLERMEQNGKTDHCNYRGRGTPRTALQYLCAGKSTGAQDRRRGRPGPHPPQKNGGDARVWRGYVL